jgi:hypothetical protein
VTEGEISETPERELSVTVPKMRAWEMGWPASDAEVRFTYLGRTEKELPLGSGEIRRQFGLKLRAQDACNLVYAMWRLEPESKVVVSVKSNPNQHSSSACGNRGYRNVKPSRSATVPAVKVGSMHTLRATEERGGMKVFVDGALVWEGFLGAEAMNLFGPAGIRSDNVHVTFTMYMNIPEVRYNNPIHMPACKVGPSE